MAMIEQVRTMCAQHDGLRILTRDYAEELTKPTPDLAALASCRWKLMRLLSVHLAFEDRHLYAMLTHVIGPAATLGGRLASELGHLEEDLQDHVRDWTSARIAEDWAAYRASSHQLIAMLTERMDREEAELYPLVLVAKAA